MKTTGVLRAFPLAALAALALLPHGRAAERFVPPKTVEVWSPNNRFCALMDVQKKTTTCYRVGRNGQRQQQWSMPGWFRVAYLADDGEHFITGLDGARLPLNYTKDQVMISFYEKGELTNEVTIGQLVQNPGNLRRTPEHYLWGTYGGLDAKGRFVVDTVEKRRLAFDVTTGKLVK